MLRGLYLTDSFAAQAIRNILGGRNAEGTTPFPYAIPFTKNPDSHNHVTHVLALALDFCKENLTPDDITPLAAKLLTQYTRSGRLGPLRLLVDAINAEPSILSTPASINAIIRKQIQRRQKAHGEEWLAAVANAPPRRLLLSIPPFSLQEATDPRHLLQDTIALGHCVGHDYEEGILARHGLTIRSPDRLQYLSYWQSIMAGNTRIISLMENGIPRVTIEYRVPTKTLGHIEGNVKGGRNIILPTEHAKALANLSRVLDLHKTQRVKLYRFAHGATHPPGPGLDIPMVCVRF